MPWTRASSLSRALACPASTVLPVYDEKSQLARDAADWGTLAHHWAATGTILDHRYAELLEKHIEECGIDRLALWPVENQVPATAFGIDCETKGYDGIYTGALTRTYVDEWKASHPAYCVTGEWDYAQVVGPRGWVDDLKTGRPEDPDCPQISLYALALYMDFDGQLNEVATSVTHWPRPNLYAAKPRSFKPPVRYWGTPRTADWLDHFYADLVETYETRRLIAESANPEDYATPGDHCLYCPARMFCPRGND
jgi:hypothetical protein